ncbi:drs2 neo1 protein, partial [Coemansia sp. RSA 2599]
ASSFGDTQGYVEIPNSFDEPSREEEEWARARALEALHQFSTEGLRTLVYAHKEIPESTYEAWHQRYVLATTALNNRQQQVEAICEEIESDLLLSGVSAIEDRLQSGVPETIFKLRRAGIRVWMLTGDKVETAINIAKSCRLIDTDVVQVTRLDAEDGKEDEKDAAGGSSQADEVGGGNGEGRHQPSKDKMTLLVLQSMTDSAELDRVLSQALVAARSMAASVDERFERRSRLEKLRRGMKRFGSIFVPRRGAAVATAPLRDESADVRESLLRHDTLRNGDAGKSPLTVSVPETRSGSWEKTASGSARYLETPIVDPSEGHAADQHTASAAANVHALRPATTEIEWADQIEANGASRGLERDRAKDAKESGRGGPRAISATGSSLSSSLSSSSSRASDTTKGVSKRGPASNAGESSNGGTTAVSDFPTSGAGSSAVSSAGDFKVGSGGPSLAVVIDGETLGAMEEHASSGILDKFLTLGTLCDAVICSRVSPSQKALIVHNMRVRCESGGNKDVLFDGDGKQVHGGQAKSSWRAAVSGAVGKCVRSVTGLFRHDNDHYMVTLAIGDGGNDIAMIQEAHVGIGIAGQEGLQASRAADFSIGQFRFLQKLLLVHGRWSYVRVSMFIMGTFYKCMAFYITQLIFQFYTGFSGTSLFESWTLSMYNTLFSILPVLVVGIFEQDLRPETLLNYPELYRDMGPKNHLFTVPLFIRRVVVIGILHSIVAAYFPFATNLFLGEESSSNDMYINGLVVYSIMVLIVTFKIAYVDVRRWVVFSHVSVVLTLVVWFGWNGVLNHIYPSSPGDGYIVLGTFVRLLKKGNFWFQWIIFTAIAVCLNVLIMLVYTVKDPVEHRIMSWVAHERRQEHLLNKARRREWLLRKGGFGSLLARSASVSSDQ